MQPNHVTVNVCELIRFFDEKPAGSVGHATAVVAVLGEDLGAALLIDHFTRQGHAARLHAGPVTTGPKGPRLDRWLEVGAPDEPVLYQVEIKNYSAHAIGGKVFPWNASPEEGTKHRIERWRHFWDDTEHSFRWGALRKVLVKMNPPRPLQHCTLAPLICFWDAMHPHGEPAWFFTVQARGGDFPRVNVFSMSSYLRSLEQEQLALEMPNVTARFRWLGAIAQDLGVKRALV